VSYVSQPELIPGTIITAVDFLAGPNNTSYAQYFAAHKWGDVVADLRAGYKVNRHFEVGFIIKNVANHFYELRPGKPEPIRNYTMQFRYNF
jgi:outer membrane cobalamin receptor